MPRTYNGGPVVRWNPATMGSRSRRPAWKVRPGHRRGVVAALTRRTRGRGTERGNTRDARSSAGDPAEAWPCVSLLPSDV